MSCRPIPGRPWYCDEHWPLPLYPDGKCNRGREEERVSKTIHEIPTPVSAFRPVGLPAVKWQASPVIIEVEPDPFPSPVRHPGFLNPEFRDGHDYDACREYTEAEKDRAWGEGFEVGFAKAVEHLGSETPLVDDEVVSNALGTFKLVNESQRASLWQVVRNLIEAGGRRAASLSKEG